MQSSAMLLTGGDVFVGDGRVLKHTAILIEEGRIQRVSAGKIPASAGAITISLAGCTILPGLIDCHTHIALDGSADPFAASLHDPPAVKILKAANHAKQTLLAGVTTIRDMGGADGVDLAIRDAIRAGLISGPRILASGRVICVTGGHGWPIGREADGADEVAKAVREQIKAGADLIKFMVTGGAMTPGSDPGAMQMTPAELAAGIQEARKAGRKTAAHAKGAAGIMAALRAGIDSIEHGTVLTPMSAEYMAKNNIPLVLTLSALYHMERAPAGAVPAQIMAKARAGKPMRRKSIALARRAGVVAAMGTDAGTPFNPHGANPGELARLVEAGYPPVQALQAATSVAARTLGLENELGTIAPGKIADLIAVSGNPVDDVALLADPRRLKLIVQGGNLIHVNARNKYRPAAD